MKKILVMEDDRKIAAALAIRLEAAGYEVLAAPDGFRGLKMAVDEQPDLILTDIWMPVGTGFSVCWLIEGETKAGARPLSSHNFSSSLLLLLQD